MLSFLSWNQGCLKYHCYVGNELDTETRLLKENRPLNYLMRECVWARHMPVLPFDCAGPDTISNVESITLLSAHILFISLAYSFARIGCLINKM